MKFTHALCLASLCMTVGCASHIEDYADQKPDIDLRTFMNGDIDAWGTFIDTSGKADPSFHVAMNGAWEGNDGTLKEHFVYNDGHTQDRVWHLRFTDDHHLTGTADDVVGTASGEQFGNAAEMKYVLTVPTKDGSSYDMSMDDWIYLINDTTALNRNVMSKFGLKVGELVITFHKTEPVSAAQPAQHRLHHVKARVIK